jgi:type VI secretion system protein ImpE
MNAAELYQAGRLDEAIEALGAALRAAPTDARLRTFLFELLCFAGEFERAEKQLAALAAEGGDAEAGALLYRGALHAERDRLATFEGALPPSTAVPSPVRGTLNGQPFDELTDADPRIGPRLELFVAGQYLWLPLEHVAAVSMEPPRRLRDLLWAPIQVRPAPAFQQVELGEALMPVLTAGAWRDADQLVRLGRVTSVTALPDGQLVPVGQKLWLVDDEEFPLLELRELTITPAG